MIPRYSVKPIADIWSRQNQLRLWVHWECILPAIYHGNLSTKIDEAVDKIDLAKLEREMDELERTNGHDVASFVQALQRQLREDLGVDPEIVNQVHRYPITSSDIVDNAMMEQISQSLEVVESCAANLMHELSLLAATTTGKTNSRTHGQVALPMAAEHRWGQHHSEIERCYDALISLSIPAKVGGIDGSADYDVHNFKTLVGMNSPNMGPVRCTQVIPRDCHARIANELALLSTVVGRLALTIRLLSQTGINEVSEPKPSHYKGSSAMPHKHNPTISENVSGMARLARSYAGSLMESVELWLERDISHSCVERVVWPDLFHIVCYQLDRMTRVIKGLVINDAQVSHFDSAKRLDELIAGGADRETAYRQVQNEQTSGNQP